MLRPTFAISQILLLAAIPGTAFAQAALMGRVVDAEDGQAISGAEIRLIDSAGDATATTLGSGDGTFSLEIRSDGFYSLEVRRVGYALLRADSLRLSPSEPTEVEIRLGVEAVSLDPVVVIAPAYREPLWLSRFRERAETNRRLGRGRIYTREDIDRIQPIRAEHLLANYNWRGGCQPEILVDGLPADASLSMMRGDELEGAEIYRGFAQIPPEYYRMGMCGLVMLWRRTDGPAMGPLTWKRIGLAGVVLLLMGASVLAF